MPTLMQWVKRSSIATVAAKVTASAWIQSPVWEFPYAADVILKRQKQKTKNKPKKQKL